MSDEPRPPDPPAASASIHDSTISDSTVHLTSVDQRGQQVGTQYNAGGNITVNAATWQRRYEPPLAEAQDLLDALLAPALPPISPLPSGARMPFAPNPHFVGRDAVLLALARALHGGARVAIGPKAAATGLGGIGKTSIAVELAHRYGSFFAGGVFWLSFADPAAIASEVAACGGPGLLDLHPSYGDLKQDEQLALVRDAWQRPIPRLLIFDNAEDPQLVQQWAPASGGCRVLITSRRQSWPGRIVTHSLDVLARPASVALLRDLAPRLTPEDADELAEELGDFPLALQLAGSYLAQYPGIKVASYLAELRSDVILAHPSLRGVHDGDVSTTAHDRHVGRTFLVSYQKLHPERDALALALLTRAACLAPGAPIPLDLLLASAELAQGDTAGQVSVGRLVELGFVTLGDDGVLVHRLVHAFVRALVKDERALVTVEHMLDQRTEEAIVAGYPAGIRPFLPHLIWVVRGWEYRDDMRIATLCSQLGGYYRLSGDYESALRLCERALVITETLLGCDHPEIALHLNNVAALLDAMGDYEAAHPRYERALLITQSKLGNNHLQTALCLNNLGVLLVKKAEYGAARLLHEQALAIYEQLHSAPHADIAMSLSNLAGALECLGEYGTARVFYERALKIDEELCGVHHPRTATTLDNLAGLLANLGEYTLSRALYERALKIREKTLGINHPDTALSINNVASLLWSMGEYRLARPLFEQALRITEMVLGGGHPQTAMGLSNLANLLVDIGEYEEARKLYERALTIKEAVFGDIHPDTATSLNNLAELLRVMGDYETSFPLYKRMLEINERIFGENHLRTAQSINSLAHFYFSTSNYEAARPLVERALMIKEMVLGIDHPETAVQLNNLAALLRNMGEYRAARPLYERALMIYEGAFGLVHPYIATTLHNLAYLLEVQGVDWEAQPLYERALTIYEQALGSDHPTTETVRTSLELLIAKLKDTA